MRFLQRNKNQIRGVKTKFYKRRGWRVTFSILALAIIFLGSFFAYIFATGSKIFDKNSFSDSPLLKAIKGEQNSLGQDRINILIMGRGGDNHPGGLLTDSIMLVSIEPKTKALAMMSIPRDLQVSIKGHGQDKINTAYSDGYNDYMQKNCKKKNLNDCKDDALSAGANMTRQTVSETFDLPIQYYAMMDFYGFVKIVNEVGGLDVNVEKAIHDPFYPDNEMKGYSPFSIKAGKQHLTGELALKYARSRETTSDFDRSRRQQQIIASLREKIMSLGFLANPKKVIDMATILGSHVRTDLSPTEIKALAEYLKNINSDSIITKVLSNAEGGPLVSDSSGGTYTLVPKKGNFSELRTIAANIFSSSDTKENAKIEVINASQVTGNGGRLANILEKGGYTVVNIAQASSKEVYKKTIIYDYSNGKNKATIKYLKDLLSAEVVTKTTQVNKNVDISIYIGEDYKGAAKVNSAN